MELTTIVVDEYDPAIEFFVGALGFELVEDTPSTTNDGRPKRWVVVRPPGAESGILLARAELDGVWAEVTATPVRATWSPGDGGRAVTCLGPGRPHPGHDDATTDCGHVYTVMGDYSIEVAVTYEVTWSSSTGASGTQDPIVLSTDLPIHVEQRQAVTT